MTFYLSSFKFGDVQFLDIRKFLGGATTLDSFLRAYKYSETEVFFPYEWFDNPDKQIFPNCRRMKLFSVNLEQQSSRQRLHWL